MRFLFVVWAGQNLKLNKIMKITKKMLINYLVDVRGYGEDEAVKIASLHGTNYLNDEEKEECINFNS